MSDNVTQRILTEGKFPEIKKMKQADLREEVQMWRNIWGWTPSAVKFYTAKVGSTIGIQVRNYHRTIGILLDTKWTLTHVEIGTYEKIYDQNDGMYYFERKIVQVPIGQINSLDWIAERTPEKDITGEESEPPVEDESESDDDLPEKGSPVL